MAEFRLYSDFATLSFKFDSVAKPANFKAVLVADDKLQLSWDAVEGVDGFELVQGESNDLASASVIYDGKENFFVADVEAGKDYFFGVRAYKEQHA